MSFKIIKQSKKTLARNGIITTKHSKIQTPVFMPCATFGAVKGISPQELEEIGFEVILSNTYHLYLKPGAKEIKKLGGLHNFMGWKRAILTDSGGYQIFSLGKGNSKKSLVRVGDSGIKFTSHIDGSKHYLTPEKVIDIQRDLGSDIIMVLDECTEFPAKRERAEKSLEITHKWAKKSIDYWKNLNLKGKDKPLLFGIIQGSIYKDLREKSAEFIKSLPFDGIAVGGVSVGEGKTNMYKVIDWLGPLLPKDKPRYLMGVGEPEDIIYAAGKGFDMFDCVIPTRLGRHGTVFSTKNWKDFYKLDLRKQKYLDDKEVIMKGCKCPACKNGYLRAYISYLIREKEMLGSRFATLHNLYLYNRLLYNLRRDL